MGKEKTIKIDKQTIIIICTSVLLVIGFLVWDNINKREIEFQREKLEQEINQQEQVNEPFESPFENPFAGPDGGPPEFTFKDCLASGLKEMTNPTHEEYKFLKEVCSDLTEN